MDLALNNLQKLICHKTQTTNQLNHFLIKLFAMYFNVKLLAMLFSCKIIDNVLSVHNIMSVEAC